MTFRREFVRCVIASALLCLWASITSAQTSRSRGNPIEQVEPEFVPSNRPSPFYDDPPTSSKSTTVRRESLAEIDTSEPASPVREKTPLPTTDFADEGSDSNVPSNSSFGPSLFWAFGILAIGWIVRQYLKNGGPLQGRMASSLEVLSRQALGPQQQLALIRLGTRVLLVGTTPSGMSTLATIEDPTEVAHLMAELRPTTSTNGPTWRDLFRAPPDDTRNTPVGGVSLGTGKRSAPVPSSVSAENRGEPESSLREVADV